MARLNLKTRTQLTLRLVGLLVAFGLTLASRGDPEARTVSEAANLARGQKTPISLFRRTSNLARTWPPNVPR